MAVCQRDTMLGREFLIRKLQDKYSYHQLVQSPIRMDQHLRIPLDPLVKLLICRRRVVDINLVRHNEARLGLARYYHVAKIPVVRLHVTLPGAKMQALASSVVYHNRKTRTYLFE
jgi:hypothetical protein